MTPIHQTGEMAVWSEERWAAFETALQRELRRERQRLQRKTRTPQTLSWRVLGLGALGCVLAALLLA